MNIRMDKSPFAFFSWLYSFLYKFFYPCVCVSVCKCKCTCVSMMWRPGAGWESSLMVLPPQSLSQGLSEGLVHARMANEEKSKQALNRARSYLCHCKHKCCRICVTVNRRKGTESEDGRLWRRVGRSLHWFRELIIEGAVSWLWNDGFRSLTFYSEKFCQNWRWPSDLKQRRGEACW